MLEDAVFGELHHFFSHVHIADTRLGGLEVFGGGGEVVDGVVQAVLHGTEFGTFGGHGFDSIVDNCYCGIGGYLSGDIDTIFLLSSESTLHATVPVAGDKPEVAPLTCQVLQLRCLRRLLLIPGLLLLHRG